MVSKSYTLYVVVFFFVLLGLVKASVMHTFVSCDDCVNECKRQNLAFRYCSEIPEDMLDESITACHPSPTDCGLCSCASTQTICKNDTDTGSISCVLGRK